MSYQNHNGNRYSVRLLSNPCCVAVLLLIFADLTAWSQQPHISTALPTPRAVNTPMQVMSGTVNLIGPYDPASKLRLAINITPPKMAEEETFLKELQDRSSPNFHKWLTPEQWNARFAPAPEDEQAVVDWLTSQGLTVTARYPNRLMVDAEGTVDQIQKAFNITINKYEVNGEIEFSNDRDPVIPGNLAGIIEYIEGLNSILRMRPAKPQMKGMRGPDYSPGPVRQEGGSGGRDADKAAVEALKSSKSGSQLGSQVTNGFYDPSDIWGSNMYDYDALMAQGHCCNPFHTSGYGGGSPIQTSIGLATDGAFLNSDIYGFVAQYPYLASHWFVHWVDGTPSCCDDETTLDTEWSTATSNSRGSEYDTSSIHVYETANGFLSFGDIYQQMLTDNLVNVVNISYGLNEDYLNGLGLVSAWHGKFNMMLGLGWTIMAASGDNGASAGCGDAIAVLYPESDPDVVSVGGTQLALNSDGSFNSEVTWTGDTYSGACSKNDGGTGGGCSNLFAAPGYQSSPACGSGSRSVPDIALNASAHSGQNYYFEGSLSGVAGTSIASPEMSGFIAQANAYLLAIGLNGVPLGEVDYDLYYLGYNPSYPPHYPYYDVLKGCNSNDVTNHYGLGSYCAGTGYDLTTGWGSFNALQLSWGINAYWLGAFEAPTITFSGPFTGANGSDHWYNTDQTVSWTIKSNAESGLTPTGVAGYTAVWDNYISDPTSEPTPGSGNSFYSGPEYPNATTGSLDLASAGQGCHFATVDAWDNAGYTPGEQFYYYICYDTVPPTVSGATSPAPNGRDYNNTSVKITLTATDPGGSEASGIKNTYYSINNAACAPTSLGSCAVYSGPVAITATGKTNFYHFTEDVAGNFSTVHNRLVFIDEVAPVTKATLSGTLSGSVYDSIVKVTLSATDNYSGVDSTYYSKDGGPTTAYTAPFTVSSLGSHKVTFYSVDKAGNTETTKSVSFSIASLTSTTLTVAPNPAVVGQKVTLTATVAASLSGTPTGTVTFYHGTTAIGTGTLSGGVATITTTTLTFGFRSLTASYGGAADFIASTSPAVDEDIEQTTTTTITSSVNPSVFDQPVTFTATVKAETSGTPTGTVEFFKSGVALGTATLSGGKASLTVGDLTVKAHSITATYSGSGSYQTSTSSVFTQTVNASPTTTKVTSSLNPAAAGATVTFTAKVTAAFGPTPTGTVTFMHGGTAFGPPVTLSSSGTATFSTNTLTAGTHNITVQYNGSADDATSLSADLMQVIN